MLAINKNRALLYLQRDPLMHLSWVTAEETVIKGELASLQAIAAHYHWTVVVPAEDVLLTTLVMPKMKQAQLTLALPFALEEQLIDEVEKDHFVIGGKQQDKLLIAVVSQAKMQQWLSRSHEVGVSPQCLLPASLLLPLTPDTWTIAVDELILVRTRFMHGFAADIDNLSYYLQQLLTEETMPQELRLINVSTFKLQDVLRKEINCTVTETTLSYEAYLQQLWQCSLAEPAINLLQGKYAEQSPFYVSMRQHWRWLVYIVIALLSCLFIFPTVSYVILAREDNRLSRQIDEIYLAHFPQAKNRVAPLLRMQEKEQQWQQGVTNPLLLTLGQVGQALQANLKIIHIEYDQGMLVLTITATDTPTLTQFMQILMNEGLTVKQQNTLFIDDGVKVTLAIQS